MKLAVEDIVVNETLFYKSLCFIPRDKCYPGEQTMNWELWMVINSMENRTTIKMEICKRIHVRWNGLEEESELRPGY